MNTIDKYLFQAMDCYPYSLEETTESLGYALSYDPENTMALCLSGRIQSEQLLDYERAKECFQQALAVNIGALEVYPHYINALTLNGDFKESKKLIAFALTVKGIDKSQILSEKVLLLETMQKFKPALKAVKQIKLHAMSDWMFSNVENTEKRLEKKIALTKRKPRKKKKKSK